MRARIFYLSEDQITGDKAVIIGGDAAHIRVLRLRPGDKLRIRIFSLPREIGAFIDEISSKEVRITLDFEDENILQEDPGPRIRLYLGVPKVPTLKTLVRQITELGIQELQPVMMERSSVRKSDVVLEKLLKISEEALKQCERLRPLIIHPLFDLAETDDLPKYLDKNSQLGYESSVTNSSIANSATHSAKYLAFEGESYQPFTPEAFTPEANGAESANNLINLWVGPEGGITHPEVEKITGWGFEAVSLSPRILKVDTAVLFFIAKFL